MPSNAELYPDFVPDECRDCSKLLPLIEQWLDIQVTLSSIIIDCCDTQSAEAKVRSWELSEGYGELEEILPNRSTVERIRDVNQGFFEAFSAAADAKKSEIKQAMTDCNNCQLKQ